MQEDILYENLTVRETLTYIAMLRLGDTVTIGTERVSPPPPRRTCRRHQAAPRSLRHASDWGAARSRIRPCGGDHVAERTARIDGIVDELGLRKCIDTKVGGCVAARSVPPTVRVCTSLTWRRHVVSRRALRSRACVIPVGAFSQIVRGISGGEKKRVSIACELIGDVRGRKSVARSARHTGLVSHHGQRRAPVAPARALLGAISPRCCSWTSQRRAWTRSRRTTSWKRCARFGARAHSFTLPSRPTT